MRQNGARALARTVAIGAIMLASASAQAAIPVIDPSAIARIREVVSVGTQSLNAVRQQVQQVQQVKNTIGQIGQGRIGSILQMSGLNFSGELSLLRDLQGLNSNISDIGRSLQSVGTINPQQLMTASQNFGTARQAASQIFYANPSNAADEGKLRASRSTAVREAGIAGYGLALSTKGHLKRSTDVANNLASQVRSSTDLRTDVQANTAAILALYAEVAQQTAIQAQLLELESARTMAQDVRSAGTPR